MSGAPVEKQPVDPAFLPIVAVAKDGGGERVYGQLEARDE